LQLAGHEVLFVARGEQLRALTATGLTLCYEDEKNHLEKITATAYLAARRGLPSVEIKTPFHSTWLDNTKAKFLLGWRPAYDLPKMIDAAWAYQRGADDPRVVWYPG